MDFVDGNVVFIVGIAVHSIVTSVSSFRWPPVSASSASPLAFLIHSHFGVNLYKSVYTVAMEKKPHQLCAYEEPDEFTEVWRRAAGQILERREELRSLWPVKPGMA